jgi:hypothetical protein
MSNAKRRHRRRRRRRSRWSETLVIELDDGRQMKAIGHDVRDVVGEIRRIFGGNPRVVKEPESGDLGSIPRLRAEATPST